MHSTAELCARSQRRSPTPAAAIPQAPTSEPRGDPALARPPRALALLLVLLVLLVLVLLSGLGLELLGRDLLHERRVGHIGHRRREDGVGRQAVEEVADHVGLLL